jgi:hypothetical protein
VFTQSLREWTWCSGDEDQSKASSGFSQRIEIEYLSAGNACCSCDRVLCRDRKQSVGANQEEDESRVLVARSLLFARPWNIRGRRHSQVVQE